MDYYMPTRLYTGEKVLEKHANEFEIGKKCLIVTGKNSAKKSGALDDLTKILDEKGIEYLVYDGIVQNPTITSVIEAGKIAMENKVEFIVGIGGGSALDASKVIAAAAANEGITKEDLYALKWDNKPLPIILIGTTAGTGSEVTKVAVITDEAIGRKKSTKHDDYYAKVSFGDPRYTMSLDREFTISTGIDALAHCVEAYFCNKANPATCATSIEGTVMLMEPLKALLDKDCELTLEQRETLYNASILGGLSINMTGTTFAHNVGYYLTENYHKPHGVACAIFMIDLLDFVERDNKEYLDEFFRRIGMDRKEFTDIVEGLLPENDIKMTKEEIESILPRYENNNSVKNTKGAMTPEDIRAILEKKFL